MQDFRGHRVCQFGWRHHPCGDGQYAVQFEFNIGGQAKEGTQPSLGGLIGDSLPYSVNVSAGAC